MAKLVRIIYISRSTSAAPASGGVDPQVSRILARSRANNRKNGLTGVLYFGSGCFFQCLEGEEAAVDVLYEKLSRDERHRDLKLLSRTSIDRPTFAAWSMKYVPVEKEMTALLRRHGMSAFDPYRFDAAMTGEVVAMLHGAQEAAVPAEPGAMPPAPALAPAPEQKMIANKVLALAGLALFLIGFGLGKVA